MEKEKNIEIRQNQYINKKYNNNSFSILRLGYELFRPYLGCHQYLTYIITPIYYLSCRSYYMLLAIVSPDKIRRAIQGTFTTTVVSKSALNLLYNRKSPPGTIYYGKQSVREFFTTDWEVILQVKTCSKGPNLRQGKPPVVNIFYGGKRFKKGAKLRICSPAIFIFEFTAGYDGR